MTKKATKKAPKKTQKIGKRESSILLFMVVIACLIFIGWNEPGKPMKIAPQPAAIGGAFALVDQNGAPFSSEKLIGKKALVFFGFTNCPSVCPTAMAVISAAMEQLDPAQVQPLFITVDPERDTPETIKAFLANFDPHFIGLTGDAAALEKTRKDYKIYAQKAGEKAAENYDMDHSSLIYLMDSEGFYLTHFTGNNSAEEIVAAAK